MPWPIPELPSSEPPKSIDWRIWSLIFVAVFGLGSATVVLLWPQGRTTHSVVFWTLVIGVPLCLFAIMFGAKLNDWEQRQLEHEERIRENARLMSLWHDWANRGVFAVSATCLPGGVDSTEEWEKPDYLLPVNLGRVRPLEWLKSIAAEKRRATIIALIADRFSAQISTLRSLHVLLLLDEKSVEEKAEWEATVRSTLAAYPIGLSVVCLPASEGLSSLSNSIDQHEVPATLILAGQFWTAGTHPGYSEGVAGILLRATQPAARSHDKNEFSCCRLLRPILSEADEVGPDLNSITQFQVVSNAVSGVWLSTLDKEAAFNLRLGISNCSPTKGAAIRDMDGALGIPGPASPWLTLAIAIEMSLRSMKPQLAAILDGASKRSVLCMLLPEMAKDQSK
jgi:hypothetical protein